MRNCPDRNEVSSTESDETPSIKSFGINIDFGDIENQRKLSIRSCDCKLTVNNINILSDDVELIDLPETSAEFTAQMCDRFVLSRPGERKKGGEGTSTQHNSRNNSFRVELPDNLKQCGTHNLFHSSLLKIDVPNDDRLFPSWRDDQLKDLGSTNCEWAIDKILRHRRSYSDTEFEIQWTTGDKSWLPYHEASHLRAITDYFEAIGVTGIENLRRMGNKDLSDEDLQVSLGHLVPHLFSAYLSCPSRQQNPGPPCHPHPRSISPPRLQRSATCPHSSYPPRNSCPQTNHHHCHWHTSEVRYTDCTNCGFLIDPRTHVCQGPPHQQHQCHIIDNPPRSSRNHPLRNGRQTAPPYARRSPAPDFDRHRSNQRNVSRHIHPHTTYQMDCEPRRNIKKSGSEFYSVRWSLEEGDEDH